MNSSPFYGWKDRIRGGWDFVQSHTMRYLRGAGTETRAPDDSEAPPLSTLTGMLYRWGKAGRAWGWQGVDSSQCLPSAVSRSVSPPGGLSCLFRRKNHLIKNRNSLPGNDPRIIFRGQVMLINFFNVTKLTLPLSIWEYSHDVETPEPERSR